MSDRVYGFNVRLKAALLPGLGVLLAAALSLAVAQPAQAWPDPPAFTITEFTVEPSTNEAGANPDLTIEMKKKPVECSFGAWVGWCFIEDLHVEQNLKKMVVELPAGAFARPQRCPLLRRRAVLAHIGR